jgi:GT2 family glycosyltransferase
VITDRTPLDDLGCHEPDVAARPTAETPTAGPVRLSVIVPVYNDAGGLRRCLGALTAGSTPDMEIIVVDDASADDSAAVAARPGVRVIRLSTNVGPAVARNRGAQQAVGDLLLFVDSDVVVRPGALGHVARLFDQRLDVAAVFGSYDANPVAAGIVSRYKNLQHHFVHQDGDAEASTFWAGCGAIRRRVFLDIGGFDGTRFRRPSVEDIDLGYRLRRAGHRILLDKTLQVTHLKRWTLRSMVWTDVWARAIPWARLIVENRQVGNDLNVRYDQRLSAVLVGVAAGCLALAPLRPPLAAVAAVALLAVIVLNRRFYAFVVRQGGLTFAGTCLLLHWLYYLYSGLAYAAVWSRVRLGRRDRPSVGLARRQRER